MQISPNRTENYVCSLDPTSKSDMFHLDLIRIANRDYNQTTSEKKRVIVRGREPRNKKMVFNSYTGQWSTVGYDMHGNMVGDLYENAQRLDVYILDRYTA